MVAEKFQTYNVKTTANTFVSQKIELFNFTHVPKQNSIAHSSRTTFSEDIFFLSRKRGGRGLCS